MQASQICGKIDKIWQKEFHHVTVLLHETIDMLDVKPDGIYVDATLGGAGHSEYLLSKLSEKGHLYAFDQDQNAIDNAQKRLAPYIEKGMVTFIKDNFRHLQARLREAGVQEIDGICYDLGVSSPQLDQRERGFSYKKDAPLDMRMNQDASLTAYEVVNHYDYHDLVRIFFKYGEDKFSKQIARKIEQAREVKPIETTTELAEIIKSAKPAKELKKKGHPAKQIFQAIRIEVNDELGAADESIQQAMDMLALMVEFQWLPFIPWKTAWPSNCSRKLQQWKFQKVYPSSQMISSQDGIGVP